MIAAPASASGKTTIARGLMALFASKGYKVQPFKCGPDYIDTKFHEAVCGRPSINLDAFMASPEHVRQLFDRYGADADVCIVEGMMGFYDGYDRERGSSYEIARILDIPVVLVVDAKSAAYSVAALLSGFANFRKDFRLAGIIYNKVGSERHCQMLRQVCDDLLIPCLGYLPKQPSLEQGSRYLGLDFSQEAASKELVCLLEVRCLFPPWEQVIPTLGTGYSHPGKNLSSWLAMLRRSPLSIRRLSTALRLSRSSTLRQRCLRLTASTCCICLVAILRSILRHWSGTRRVARPSRRMPNRVGEWLPNAVA